MPANSARRVVLFALALAGLSTGCHTTPKSTNRFQADGTEGSIAVVPNDLVEIETPMVKVEKGTIYISGSIHRKSVASEALPGRIDIEFLSPQGEYLDGLPALLTPRAVPADPNTPPPIPPTTAGFHRPVPSCVCTSSTMTPKSAKTLKEMIFPTATAVAVGTAAMALAHSPIPTEPIAAQVGAVAGSAADLGRINIDLIPTRRRPDD